MRIALVSDIHGNLAALEAVVADIRRRGADHTVCLGDNVSGPLLPLETARYLMASGWTVLAGNHERQVLSFGALGGGASDAYAHSQLGPAELAWMASLPPTARPFDGVLLCHGTPRSDCEHFLESPRDGLLSLARHEEIQERLGGQPAALVACGHSHVPRSVRWPTGPLIVNPGSVGLQAYTDDHPVPYVMERGTPDAHYAIVKRTAAGWSATHHAVAYDFASMAALARARRRADWENALLRGRVA
jgi:predicted phosphodiesterase